MEKSLIINGDLMTFFKPLSLIDKNNINALLRDSTIMKDYVSSELVFENLYAWKDIENIMISDQKTFILLKCNHESKSVYLPPIAKTVEGFLSGVFLIRQMDKDAVIYGLTKTMIDILGYNDFLILEDACLSEYIYHSSDLASLKGSKFHRKRNLLNQFKKDHDFTFRPYQDQDKNDVKDLLDRYLKQGGTDADFDAIFLCLESYKSLDIYVDLLYKLDVLVALSVSTKSIFSHGVIMFEKADIDYAGSYAAINQMVAYKRFYDVTYITRQEDLGIPSLRKSKQSYNPAFVDIKYSICFDLVYKQMYELYRSSFHDQKSYVDHFFLYRTSKSQFIYIEDHQKIISGQHIIYKNLYFNQKQFNVPFIVATATLKNHQRQGYMRRLMKETLLKDSILKQAFIYLYPEDELYYKPMGFIPINFRNYDHIHWIKKECTLLPTIDSSILLDIYQTYMKNQNGYFIRDKSSYESSINLAYLSSFTYSLIYENNKIIGYILHDEFIIEEWVMTVNILPIVDGFDFTKVSLPNQNGSKSGVMARICDPIHAINFFSSMIDIKDEVILSIYDQLLDITTNIKLEKMNEHIKISKTQNPGVFVTIEQLTNALFHGLSIKDLIQIKKPSKWMAIDMY